MHKIFLFAAQMFCSNLVYATDARPTCLDDLEGVDHAQTDKRLTVVSNHLVSNLMLNFYEIPVWSSVDPYTEGCENDDGKILIYDAETQEPLFHKSGNIHNFQVDTEKAVISKYREVFEHIDHVEMIIKHRFMANCGGCYDVLFFRRNPDFEYIGKVYYDPDKYGRGPNAPNRKYVEFGPENNKVREYFEEDSNRFDTLKVK